MASLNAPAWNLALPCSFSASAFLAPVVAASASMDAVRGSLAPFSAPSSSITAARVPCERESVRCEETSERSPRHAHFVEACVGHRTWTRPSRRQASGEASFRSCTVFRSIPALHVGHRVPMRGFVPFMAASACASASVPARDIQLERHDWQKTCPHRVCAHCVYSTSSVQILHWNSSTSASLVSTSARGKPMAIRRVPGALARRRVPKKAEKERRSRITRLFAKPRSASAKTAPFGVAKNRPAIKAESRRLLIAYLLPQQTQLQRCVLCGRRSAPAA